MPAIPLKRPRQSLGQPDLGLKSQARAQLLGYRHTPPGPCWEEAACLKKRPRGCCKADAKNWTGRVRSVAALLSAAANG